MKVGASPRLSVQSTGPTRVMTPSVPVLPSSSLYRYRVRLYLQSLTWSIPLNQVLEQNQDTPDDRETEGPSSSVNNRVQIAENRVLPSNRYDFFSSFGFVLAMPIRTLSFLSPSLLVDEPWRVRLRVDSRALAK